ncbi:MAG TPA: response regulator transcription factor [Bacteroidia bacterium]|nr:response regulator transcription factor [Bacteroidia bacterium]
METTINVGIVDDHKVFREGLIVLLARFREVNVMFDLENGQELLDILPIKKPDIVILDVDMPILSGRKTLQKIKELYPEIKVMMLSLHFDEIYVSMFFKDGANAYLPKGDGIREIMEAVNSIKEKGYYHDTRVSEILAHEMQRSSEEKRICDQVNLTNKERVIVPLLLLRKSNIYIAEELEISTRTVEWHRKNLFDKLNCKSIDDLRELFYKRL